jgi:hypothetical protein
MEQNRKQTAVEWLVEQVNADCLNSTFIRKGLVDEARAMEKEQVEQAYSDGLGNGMHYERGDASASVLDESNYYHETYGDTNE